MQALETKKENMKDEAGEKFQDKLILHWRDFDSIQQKVNDFVPSRPATGEASDSPQRDFPQEKLITQMDSKLSN